MPGVVAELQRIPIDYYLTTNPQITYFKTVYKRTTNFATESMAHQFAGDVDFGLETYCEIAKVGGSLISQIYLEIDLPAVYPPSTSVQPRDLTIPRQYHQMIMQYVSANAEMVRTILRLAQASNIDSSRLRTMIANHNLAIALRTTRNALEIYLSKDKSIASMPQLAAIRYEQLRMVRTIDALGTADAALRSNRPLTTVFGDTYFRQLQSFAMPIDTLLKELAGPSHRESFAWVPELGNRLIDHIGISVANQALDSLTGEWLSIFSKLVVKNEQVDNYNRMIGNVPALTSPSAVPKPAYKLVVPIPFWFTRNLGLSLPYMALSSNPIVSLKLRSLSDVSNRTHGINIMGARLWVEHIFLEPREAELFASSMNEYLVETVQREVYQNIPTGGFVARLDAKKPIKYLVWFVRPSQSDSATLPLQRSWIVLGTKNRTDPYYPITYYDTIVPYLYFNGMPPPGVNVYSFALEPLMVVQPSGFVIPKYIKGGMSIEMRFNDEALAALGSDTMDVTVYSVSHDIIPIQNGEAKFLFGGI